MRESWFLLLAAALLVTGCGGTENKPPTPADMQATALGDVGEVYRLYTQEKRKPPAKLADFSPMEAMSPTGVNAVQTGKVVVRFGAVLPDTNEGQGSGKSDEVLAYMKEVPESGGQVLMLDRSIKTMTAEEFKAAKLAGTASSEPAGSKISK